MPPRLDHRPGRSEHAPNRNRRDAYTCNIYGSRLCGTVVFRHTSYPSTVGLFGYRRSSCRRQPFQDETSPANARRSRSDDGDIHNLSIQLLTDSPFRHHRVYAFTFVRDRAELSFSVVFPTRDTASSWTVRLFVLRATSRPSDVVDSLFKTRRCPRTRDEAPYRHHRVYTFTFVSNALSKTRIVL